jgi:rod shape-determining protein MreB and related proteins
MHRAFDAAVDLGTAYVRVVARPWGVMIEAPSVVRLRGQTAPPRPGAPGDGRAPAARTRPLAGGVVADVEGAGLLLAGALRRARGLSLLRPRVLACIPSDATPAETASLQAALERAGARSATIVPEPLAAAVGAGLDLAQPYAQFVVDVGEGVTDVAVIRDGRVDLSGAVRVACADLRHAIVRRVMDSHRIRLERQEAQRVLEIVGAGGAGARPDRMLVHGVRPEGVAAADALVSRADVAAAVGPPLAAIVRAVRAVWQRLDEAVSCEVIESGILLTGGGARLRGLASCLELATGLDVRVAPHPLHAVILGAGRMAGLR